MRMVFGKAGQSGVWKRYITQIDVLSAAALAGIDEDTNTFSNAGYIFIPGVLGCPLLDRHCWCQDISALDLEHRGSTCSSISSTRCSSTANHQMSSNETEADMPPFPGRVIKFGNFNVTSQVQRNPTTTPFYHCPTDQSIQGIPPNPPQLRPRKPQAPPPRPHPRLSPAHQAPARRPQRRGDQRPLQHRD